VVLRALTAADQTRPSCHALARLRPSTYWFRRRGQSQRPGMTVTQQSCSHKQLMMSTKTLYTIGYEKARLADVITTLTAAGVAILIDVRDRPISRRPGFSKRQLAAAVEEAGMRYVHLQPLGTPPEGRLAGRRREWDRFWGIVEEKLAGPEAELALQQAAEIAQEAPSCLLCYESDWQSCHRRRVAEILSQRRGFAVAHLAVGAEVAGRTT
jgi:uncharacterized protein (DUF488 family)